MRRFVRNPIVYWLAFALALYWPIAPFAPRPFLSEWMNGLAMALGVGGLVAYIPGVWRDFRQAGPHPGQFIALGIVDLVVFVVLTVAWGWAYQVFDRPLWMVGNIIGIWLRYGALCGLVLMLLGVLVDPQSTSRAWRTMSLVITGSILMTLLILSLVGGSSR